MARHQQDTQDAVTTVTDDARFIRPFVPDLAVLAALLGTVARARPGQLDGPSARYDSELINQ